MNKNELQERLKKVIRELASIENDDEDFILSAEEYEQLSDMRRKLRRMRDRLNEEEKSEFKDVEIKLLKC